MSCVGRIFRNDLESGVEWSDWTVTGLCLACGVEWSGGAVEWSAWPVLGLCLACAWPVPGLRRGYMLCGRMMQVRNVGLRSGKEKPDGAEICKP